jgi:hypothetical protein
MTAISGSAPYGTWLRHHFAIPKTHAPRPCPLNHADGNRLGLPALGTRVAKGDFVKVSRVRRKPPPCPLPRPDIRLRHVSLKYAPGRHRRMATGRDRPPPVQFSSQRDRSHQTRHSSGPGPSPRRERPRTGIRLQCPRPGLSPGIAPRRHPRAAPVQAFRQISPSSVIREPCQSRNFARYRPAQSSESRANTEILQDIAFSRHQ